MKHCPDTTKINNILHSNFKEICYFELGGRNSKLFYVQADAVH
jgi:hypothetical protein